MATRQQVLFLYLTSSAMDSYAVAWAFHDGTDGFGPSIPDRGPAPPYIRGTDALRDGWRLIQATALQSPAPGSEHEAGYFRNEFVYERIVDVDNPPPPNQ